MVEKLIGMAGLTMNDGTIVAQCTRLSEKLHAHVNDSLTLTTANMTVEGRLTTLLQTPLNTVERNQTVYHQHVAGTRPFNGRLAQIHLMSCLKGLAQAKIIKKSVILFRVLNMTI